MHFGCDGAGYRLKPHIHKKDGRWRATPGTRAEIVYSLDQLDFAARRWCLRENTSYGHAYPPQLSCKSSESSLCYSMKEIEKREAQMAIRGKPSGNQPLPTRSADSVAIHELVAQDQMARAEMGARKYGDKLHSHNGRNALQDAYEEALDLCVYLKQALVESGSNSPIENPTLERRFRGIPVIIDARNPHALQTPDEVLEVQNAGAGHLVITPKVWEALRLKYFESCKVLYLS